MVNSWIQKMLIASILCVLQDRRTMLRLPLWSNTFIRPYNPHTPLTVYQDIVDTDTIEVCGYKCKLSTMLYSRNNGKTWNRLTA